MKTRILILILLLFTIHILKSQNTNSSFDPNCGTWRITQNMNGNENRQGDVFTWQSVQTSVPFQLLKVFFVDSLHGWAGHTGNGGIRSTDSGFNWTSISFNDTNFSTLYNGVFFLDQNTGWMIGGALQIRKTTDGGVTWFKQYAPPAAGIFHSIVFFDANTGIGIGSKNFPYVPFIAKSTNGGSNWVELSDAFSGAQELNNQYWFNSSTGWIAGYNVLLFTSNGGQNFTNYFVNVPPTGNGYNDLLSIWFVNQQTGWIGGSNLDKKNIYKTTNAGANWVFQDNPVSQNNYYVQINDVGFMSQDSGWAIHGTPATGAIMFTTNAGANWVVENGSSYWFQSISIYNRAKAWCSSSGGTMWYAILTQQPSGILNERNDLPEKFSLSQNFPNPFNPSTSLRFEIPVLRFVKLIVYDVLGREVSALINENLRPGSYEIKWDGSNYPSGIYFYEIQAGEFRDTKKMMLIR